MNIKDINVGDILEWSSVGWTRKELVIVVSMFEHSIDSTVCKVRVISSPREHRIGTHKTFSQTTLNHRRQINPVA